LHRLMHRRGTQAFFLRQSTGCAIDADSWHGTCNESPQASAATCSIFQTRLILNGE
jgi:hypothetical protein